MTYIISQSRSKHFFEFQLVRVLTLEATGIPELAPAAWLVRPVGPFACVVLFSGMPVLLPGAGIKDFCFPNMLRFFLFS